MPPNPAELGISKASVSRIHGHPQEPHPRYEREKPGRNHTLRHQELGRFNSVGHSISGGRTGYCGSQAAGWEYCRNREKNHYKEFHGCPRETSQRPGFP